MHFLIFVHVINRSCFETVINDSQNPPSKIADSLVLKYKVTFTKNCRHVVTCYIY